MDPTRCAACTGGIIGGINDASPIVAIITPIYAQRSYLVSISRYNPGSLVVSSLVGLLFVSVPAFAGPIIDGLAPIDVRIPATDLGCVDVENGDHELRFILRCLRIPSLPAARIASWPLSGPFMCT